MASSTLDTWEFWVFLLAVPWRQKPAGGITDFADGNKASILRSGGGKTLQFGVRLRDLVRGGELSADVAMRPGDVLIIPQSFF